MLKQITDRNHDEIIENAKLAVLDFGSAWCATCAHVERILQEIDEENKGRILMGKVDIVASPDITLHYGVMGVPTLVLLRDGQQVYQATFTGSISKEKIFRLIREHLGL